MLKACWDCLAGSGVLRDRVENEDVYDTQLNGNSLRAPPWPEPQSDNETMFLLPRRLNSGDRINISCTLNTNWTNFTISLVTGDSYPDYNNVACELLVNNRENVALYVIQNGQREAINGGDQDLLASELITKLDCMFSYKVSVNDYYNGGHSLEIYIDGLIINTIRLKHTVDSIRYIILNGDIEVKTLGFEFA